jgi:hypothetical protein
MMVDRDDLSAGRSRAAHQVEPLWLRWLNRLVGAVRGLSARRLGETAENHEPIFRIAQVWDDRWVVERPGAVIEHAFPDLEQAVAFIRNDSAMPATVELRIGDLYVVARFDPRQPGSLFGELAP